MGAKRGGRRSEGRNGRKTDGSWGGNHPPRARAALCFAASSCPHAASQKTTDHGETFATYSMRPVYSTHSINLLSGEPSRGHAGISAGAGEPSSQRVEHTHARTLRSCRRSSRFVRGCPLRDTCHDSRRGRHRRRRLLRKGMVSKHPWRHSGRQPWWHPRWHAGRWHAGWHSRRRHAREHSWGHPGRHRPRRGDSDQVHLGAERNGVEWVVAVRECSPTKLKFDGVCWSWGYRAWIASR